MEKNYVLTFKDKLTALMLSFCFCSFLCSAGFATGTGNNFTTRFNFIQNKGQLKSSNPGEASEVLYYSQRGNLQVFLHKNKISYVLNSRNYKEKGQKNPRPKFMDLPDYNDMSSHRVDLVFVNSNPEPEILTEGESADYISYYSKNKKAEEVQHYSKVVYKNLYENIDLVYHFGDNDNFKYDFIVRPGGNPEDIAINYTGSEKLSVNEDGSLRIATGLGDIKEATPYSYTINNQQEIKTAFKINQNQLTFSVDEYDRDQTLIIDPELAWSTYLGGTTIDNGFTITTDASGNVYTAGNTISSQFPGTVGAFQSSLNGVLITDVVISKFDKDGNLLWSTYYGGTEPDEAWGIATDAAGNVFVTGITESPDFPTTAGALQTATTGIRDAFILKFDASGNRLYASFFGGEGNDFGFGLVTDAAGNVYITGYTASVVGLPILNASQPTPAAGEEAFIAKFDNSLNLLWSTYFGGNSSDNAYSIAVDSLGNPYITGRTTSTNLPAALNATGIGEDIFITKFNTLGTPLWTKYIGGTGNEVAYGIAVDGAGGAYITGSTTSSDLPVTSGYFPATYNGGTFDAVVGKVDASGTTEWLTYYGGAGYDIGNEITIDDKGKVNMIGHTTSANLILSGDAFQAAKSAGEDAFILRLTADGALDWGTYFGGSDDERGFDIAYNKSKALYHIVGSTRSVDIPIKNAEQPAKAGDALNDIDIFIATFCADVENNTIAINGNDTLKICTGEAIATITGSVPTGAGTDFTYQYQASADGINWTSIAGATGIDYTPSGLIQTTYFRRLVIYGGPCENPSNTVVVIVNPLPVVDFTATNLCVGSPVTFSNSSTVASGSITAYSWNFGDGNTSTDASPTHTYATQGSYNVTLIATTDNGCIDSLTKTITIDAAPDAEFTAEAGCPGTATVFTNVSTGAITSYLWDFGDGTTSNDSVVSHFYTAGGTYLVKLTAATANGCTNTDSAYITVNPKPVASFTYAPGTACTGDSTLFTNTSTLSSGTIISSEWTFGDGGTSIDMDPAHLYAAAGSYPVTLIVTSDQGCKDTITMNVTITDNPVADFTATGLCEGSPTAFSGTSADAIATWSWNFGDGNTGSGQNVSHTYANAGPYTVTLIAENANGCTDTVIKNITLDEAPVAAITASALEGCPGETISFTDASTIATGTITSWSWDFGDGNTSTDQNTSHTFINAGTYNITLTVASTNGCSDNASVSVTINPAPAADFTVTACTEQVANFTDLSTVSSGTIVSWSWDFGDGNTSSMQNPTHTYTTTGNVDVQLTVTTDKGCVGTIIKTITVNPSPVADFDPVAGCSGTGVAFTDNSTGAITQWLWNFGDGSTSAEQNPVHTYANAGTYTVTLTVATAAGCSTSVSKDITIEASPIAGFTFNGSCPGQPVTFTDASAASTGSIITAWSWNFGDGGTAADQNPAHIYATGGSYTVALTVTASNGCTNTLTQQVVISDKVTADFTSGTACVNTPVIFTDNSTGGAVEWSWSFGTTAATTQNASHIYTSEGTFNVTLAVKNAAGCTDIITKTVTINPAPVADFSSDGVCPGVATRFSDNSTISSGTINKWLWSFGDGNSSAEQNPSNTYKAEGNYNVQLTISSAEGCTGSINKEVTIAPAPVVNAGPDVTIKDGKGILLSATSTVAGTYSWSPANGLDNASIATPFANPAATTNYTVTVTTENGCVSADDITVSVEKPLVIPSAFTPNGDGANDEFEIQNIDQFPDALVEVYNRWGSKLFSSQNPSDKWDGKNRGEDMPMGAYYYVIDLKDGNEPIKGTISIIK